MLPTKFRVYWPFGSGEAKNRFSRWPPSWMSDQNDFSYFWSISHPNASYQVSSPLAQGCRRSRLLKQLLNANDERQTKYDGHWLITTARLEHFVLRWAKKGGYLYSIYRLLPNSWCIYISQSSMVGKSNLGGHTCSQYVSQDTVHLIHRYVNWHIYLHQHTWL